MSFYSNKTVLITGATGLIGSHTVNALMQLKDVKIIALSRSEEKLKSLFCDFLDNDNFKIIAQDISEPLKIKENIDIIFHGAGSISGSTIKNRPVDIIKPNVLGTVNCLEFLKKQKEFNNHAGKIVIFSSATVYGNLTNMDIEVSEGDTFITDGLDSQYAPYSQSKRMSETLAHSYYQQYGIEAIIARFSYVYGYSKYRANTAFWEFIDKAISGENIVLNGTNFARRDNIYVKDAVKMLLSICEKGQIGEAYNISSGNKGFAAMDEIAHIIVNCVNKKFNSTVSVIEKEWDKNIRNAGLILNNTKTLALTGLQGGG